MTETKTMFRITIDSREQRPFTFAGYPVAAVPGTLTAGDYSLPGFANRVAVERKSLNDLLGCLTRERERFRRELEHLRGYESAVVVVESGFDELAAGRYRSKLNPASAVQSVIALMQEFRMPFFFAGSRPEAERFTFDFLRHSFRHAEARYRAICGQPKESDGVPIGKPAKIDAAAKSVQQGCKISNAMRTALKRK